MIGDRVLVLWLIVLLLQPTRFLTAAQESAPPAKLDGRTVVNPLPVHKGPCDRAIQPVAPQDLDIENLKIFDDAVMQQQLETNFARIAALSGVDQASLTSHLGNVTGMNQTFSGLAFSVQGPSTNQIASTTGAQNVQTIGTTTVSSGTTAGSNGTSVPVSNNQTVNQTTSNPATLSTVATQPSVTVPTSTPATAPAAVTSGFSVQSSAVLSEQMQLTSRLNTELLEEEGALSDRLIRYSDNGGQNKIDTRPRATIGFDATMMPTKKEKNAAVIVDLFVAPCQLLAKGIPPAVTALLPSEETFNVASVRSNSTSIGAGVATQFLGASGSFLFGHNQYFLVQDIDILAQVFTPSKVEKDAYCAADPNTPENERQPDDSCLGIRWIVRPVLGKPTVSLERRKFFAQIAFPTSPSTETLGVVTIRAQWRHFDQKTGLIGEKLKHSIDGIQTYKIDQYRLEDIKPAINSVEDLGNGQVVVRLEGSYFSGTYVRIGNAVLVDAPSGLVREPNALRFVAWASDLMTKRAYLVSRNGEQTDLTIPVTLYRNKPSTPTVKVSTLDSTYSHVSISYCEQPNPNSDTTLPPPASPERGLEPMLLLIAGKVYGLSDAPVDHDIALAPTIECNDDKNKAQADWRQVVGTTIPTSVLTSSPFVLMGPILAKEPAFSTRFSLYTDLLSPLSQPDKLVVVAQRKDGADLLLYGNRLDKIETIEPKVELKDVVAGSEADTPQSLKALSLSKQQLGQYKFLVVTRKGEGPEAIVIPDTKLPESADTPVVTATVLKNDDTATVTGEGLTEIDYVVFKGVRIPCRPTSDGTSAVLTNLRRAGVTTQAQAQSLVFFFKRRQVTVKMDVYTQKVVSTAAPATK
jgi:hypothetical protein